MFEKGINKRDKLKEYLDDFNKNYYDFEMFTPKGNEKVKQTIQQIIITVFDEKKITVKGMEKYIKHLIESVSKKKKYSEINDTEPETHIQNHTNKVLKFCGYDIEVNRWRF